MALLEENSNYGRNGLEEFGRVALERGWQIVRIEMFQTTENASAVNVTRQLNNIKNTGM